MKKFLLMAMAIAVSTTAHCGTLINGTPVKAGTWPEVVNIRTGNSGCTGTVIGPRVLLTASHCGENGKVSSWKIDGKEYKGTFQRSKLYPAKDHDVAAVIVDKVIVSSSTDVAVKPATVAALNVLAVGQTVQNLGYGCTQAGGGGGNDGVLREGSSKVSGFSNYDAVTKGGAALCFGDSGGPMYTADWNDTTRKVVGVNSKGNIKDTNYITRLDSDESRKFLEDLVVEHKVDICGVNSNCTEPGPSPDKFVVECAAAKFSVESKGVHNVDYVKRMTENLCAFLEVKSTTDDDVVNPVAPIHPVQPIPTH